MHSSNLLYPKEDRATNQLMFTCRTCHVGEPATSYCVYQNKLHSQVGDTAGVTQDVASDPTVRLSTLLFPTWQIQCLLGSRTITTRMVTGFGGLKLVLLYHFQAKCSKPPSYPWRGAVPSRTLNLRDLAFFCSH